jgi:hypothetical protein
MDYLLRDPPEILILRGLGSEAALEHLRADLETRGAAYTPHYLPGPAPFAGLGFLSRVPGSRLRDGFQPSPYSIGSRRYLPMFGSLELPLSEHRNLHIVNAQLPPAEAEYERRRNEFRLLSQELKSLLEYEELVLVSLHTREDPDSPMARMLTETGLIPLKPVDGKGDRWTFRDPEGLEYLHDQWVLVSPALQVLLTDSGEILDTPELRTAGPNRHQVLRIRQKTPAN